jgi:NAD(P)-dependent dehydrogenase (short-subunit alcohol dehydrogenase family)
MENSKGAVLVTGTSSGIGRATALRLEQMGFQVFATVRRPADADDLRAQGRGSLSPLLVDVTDPDSIRRASMAVQQAVGPQGLAGLVNNAGVGGLLSPLEFIPLERVRAVFEVNFFGLLAMTQAFLPLVRQGSGRIVNISSVATLFHSPYHGPYTAAKLAVNGITNSLRQEVKPLGVQVALVIVGTIHTPIWERGREQNEREYRGYPPEADTLYGKRYQQLVSYFTHLGAAGSPPEAAARVVTQALTERRVRHTYYAGKGALFNAVLEKLVYGRLRDWAVAKVVGLSNN